MRLICPNCGAQYEVPDEVIPENGRDVQCSNCGDTWFQAHPDHSQTAPDGSEAGYDEGAEADWGEQAQPAPEDEYAAEYKADTDVPEETAEETAPAGRRELDPDVAGLLREEAARERQAREAEARGGLETQPDLGLSHAADDGDRRSEEARARMARLRGEDGAPDDLSGPVPSPEPGTRRALLPDIEEINSTIPNGHTNKTRDASARDGSMTATAAPARGGFGRGMRLAVGLALVATAIYMFAPRIAGLIPATAEPLAAYVEAVDRGRALVNEQIALVVAQVQALTGG